MPAEMYNAVAASVDSSGKINLPVHMADRLPWRSATSGVEAWLFVIQPGRYRLITVADVERSASFRVISDRITNTDPPNESADPWEAEGSVYAGSSARLVPVSLSFTKGPGWRLFLSKQSYPMVSLGSEGRVFALFSEGYLELWSPDLLNRVLEEPLGKAVP